MNKIFKGNVQKPEDCAKFIYAQMLYMNIKKTTRYTNKPQSAYNT